VGEPAAPQQQPPLATDVDTPPPDPPTDAVDSRSTPPASWRPLLAFVALGSGLVFAVIGSLLVDIPAIALGVNVSSSHVPPGLTIADTAVQDAGFVGVAVFFAQLGGRKVDAAMFGLRPTRLGRAVWLVVVTLVSFLIFSVLWTSAFHASREKLLEQLGANETTALLVLSAALTCVIAPFAEEFLFRGFIFTALRNWRGVLPAALITGVLFGAVHVGSAPVVDLVPLAALGFGLCLLYRATGSLYPCIAAHCVNNTIAFGSLEEWGLWQVAVLMASALAVLAIAAVVLTQLGIASRERAVA
jgi:membrane protease YdiL (CAAX protease family)